MCLCVFFLKDATASNGFLECLLEVKVPGGVCGPHSALALTVNFVAVFFWISEMGSGAGVRAV